MSFFKHPEYLFHKKPCSHFYLINIYHPIIVGHNSCLTESICICSVTHRAHDIVNRSIYSEWMKEQDMEGKMPFRGQIMNSLSYGKQCKMLFNSQLFLSSLSFFACCFSSYCHRPNPPSIKSLSTKLIAPQTTRKWTLSRCIFEEVVVPMWLSEHSPHTLLCCMGFLFNWNMHIGTFSVGKEKPCLLVALSSE